MDEAAAKRNDRYCQNCGAKGSLIDDDSPACGCCFKCGQDFFAALKNPAKTGTIQPVAHQVAQSSPMVGADTIAEDIGNLQRVYHFDLGARRNIS